MNLLPLVLFVAVGAVGLPMADSAERVQTPGPASQQPAAAAATNPQNGKDIYLRYSCYACHGYAGHGGAGTRLVPMRQSLSAFTSFVRNPASMPPYTSKVLSDAQIADVWAYIKTLPESPPAKSIALLNQP